MFGDGPGELSRLFGAGKLTDFTVAGVSVARAATATARSDRR